MKLETKDVVSFIKKQPVLMICVGISFALGAVLYFRSDALDQQTQAHNDKKDEDERLRKNIEYASKLPAQLMALEAANKEAQARAVHPRELSLNLQYFYRIESETGVKDQGGLHHGGVVRPTTKNAPKTVFLPDAYTVSVQGDFRQLMDLLRHIEQGSHFSRELNAVIAPTSKEDPNSTSLTLVLNLELLSMPAP